MRHTFIIQILLFFLISLSTRSQQPQTTPNYYTNPIIAGMNPDPSICSAGDDYYLVTSTFFWFPGVPVYHSKDLINWELLGYALSTKEQLNLDKGSGIYAATIRYNDNKFYVITTNRRNGENFFVTASNPAGPWSSPVWVDQKGIDPSLFFEYGKVYCTSTTTDGIIQSEIDVNTGKLLTEPKMIWRGTGARNQEAPHLYKYKGLYYLFIAEGGTEYGHQVSVARSTSPWGPFESYTGNPILTQNKRLPSTNSIQGAGHADMLDAKDGSWWMVFLAFRPIGNNHHLGRETFLSPMSWSAAGWPIIPFDGTAQTENYTKTLALYPFAETPVIDTFDGPLLELPWNFIRNPLSGTWSLTERKGFLRLHGLKGNLTTSLQPQFIGRRQQYFDCVATTSIDFVPKKDNEEAGLSVFHMPDGHYDIFIRQKGSKREVVLRYVLGKIVHEEKTAILSNGNVQLRVEAHKSTYTFSYQQEGSYKELGTVETKFLSSEVLGGFVGVFIGVFAAGNEANAETPADFDWFEIKKIENK